MRKKCSQGDCPAPKGLCAEHASPEHAKCEHWLGNENSQIDAEKKKNHKKAESLPWTGEPFLPADIEIVSQRSLPLIIGMIGGADAGKTSYLGMLYTLLSNGKKIPKWSFGGSYTLAAWETLSKYLKIKSGGNVEFSPPTPSNPDFYSLYHLFLKKDKLCRDILFADSSGEVFSLWSENTQDPNAENARWIYEKSSAFIFMVDSVALAERRGAAKTEIVQMAEQLAANLKGRPVAIVWSKADKIDNIRDKLKEALKEDLFQVFDNSKEFHVSNFSKTDPDTLCHENNIAVTQYLLDKMDRNNTSPLVPQAKPTIDQFFNYTGRSSE